MRARATWLLLFIASPLGAAEPSEPAVKLQPNVLTLEAAVSYALSNNPALATQRQQHGIAAARVVIADTYPFNPIMENRVQAAFGPPAAAVDNHVPIEQLLLWEVEVKGQRRYRRQAAAAALSRTDWEIAAQEQALAVQVIRAYVALLYRQEKQRLLEETLKFNQQLVDDIRRLQLKPSDLITAQTEVTDALKEVAAGRETLVAARFDLNRALGAVNDVYEVEGPLETPPPAWVSADLGEIAVARRADLQAQRLAVAEAMANARLARANRWGNPTIGPAFIYDPTKISSIGAQINFPLPLFNRGRGEILRSEAEQTQAVLKVTQAEVAVRQEVAAAVAKLNAAEQRAETFRSKLLPELKQAVEDMDRQFKAGRAELLQVIDVRRKLLKARGDYLDVLWNVRDKRADVLAATGEPVLDFRTNSPGK